MNDSKQTRQRTREREEMFHIAIARRLSMDAEGAREGRESSIIDVADEAEVQMQGFK